MVQSLEMVVFLFLAGALELCRIVYVARNPKDVCVSFFKMMSEPESGFVGDFPIFAELFKSGLQVTNII